MNPTTDRLKRRIDHGRTADGTTLRCGGRVRALRLGILGLLALPKRPMGPECPVAAAWLAADSAQASGSGCVTTCQGTVSVIQGLIRFEPASPRPAACILCYSVADEDGQTAAARITISAGAALAIFADGFESRDTSKWSETHP